MKKIIIFLLLILPIISFTQVKKNKISISGILTHYINIEEEKLYGGFDGYYNYVIVPGTECLYSRLVQNSLEISIGINYQIGKVASYISEPTRFQFHEISLPILFRINKNVREKGSWHLSTGSYIGKTLGITAEVPGKYDKWTELDNYRDLEGYSNDKTFIDIYFDTGYSVKLKYNKLISFSPYLKHRINTTWLNAHQKKFQYGVKLSYSFNL